MKQDRFPKVKDIEKHYAARKELEIRAFRNVQLFCIIENIFHKNNKDILNFRFVKEKLAEHGNIKKLFKNGVRKWIKATELTSIYNVISREEKDEEGNDVIEEYLVRTGNDYLNDLFSNLKRDIILVPFPEQYKKQKSSFVVSFNWVFGNDNILYKDLYEKKEERTKFKSQINYDKLSQSLLKLKKEMGINEQEYDRKIKYLNYLKNELKKKGINNTIYLTGSSYTQLGLKNSDLDIGILTESKEESKELLGKLKLVFENLGMKNIIVNDASHSRVCLCNFNDEKEQIDVDININCEGLMKNIQLFKIYDIIDERFRILVIAIKYWVKQRGIDKGDVKERMINSYTYILLLIYFLQVQQVLPSAESLQNLVNERNEYENKYIECSKEFCYHEQDQERKEIQNQINFSSTNKNSVGKLLVDFLEFYGFEFNYAEDVICPRLGRPLTKKEKHWEKCLMGIEDPILSDINKGSILFPWCYEGIINEFKLAFIKTSEYQKDFVQEVCQPLQEFNYLPSLIYPPIDKNYKSQLLEDYIKTLKD